MRPLLISICLILVATSLAAEKDEVREAVKHGTDRTASKILLTPKAATIEDLAKLKRPLDLPNDLKSRKYEKGRIAPLESTIWRVDCRLKEIVLSRDGDFRLVIESQSGARTIVEVPDPRECRHSPFLKGISKARQELARRFHPTKAVQKPDALIEITAIGFFGPLKKSSKNVPANGARLMPAIAVKFNTN